MKIPVYAEVSLDDCDQFNLADLKKCLEKAHVGLTPSYLITHHLHSQRLLDFLDLLGQALAELKLSERFPYPLYIITSDITTHSRFYLASNIESLPSYFFKKVKRLKSKEQLLLSKVLFLGEKVCNIDIPSKLIFLRNQATLNRELSTLCHELNAYDKILEQLKMTLG